MTENFSTAALTTIVGFSLGVAFGYNGKISLALWVVLSILYESLQAIFAKSKIYNKIEDKINFEIFDPDENLDEKIFDTLVRYIGYVMGHYIRYKKFILI